MLSFEEDAEQRALTLFNRGNPWAAIAILDVATAREESAGNLWLLRAIIRHSQAAWSDALADIETAMCLLPLPPAGQLVLADCYAHTGHRAPGTGVYRLRVSAQLWSACQQALRSSVRWIPAVRTERFGRQSLPRCDCL